MMLSLGVSPWRRRKCPNFREFLMRVFYVTILLSSMLWPALAAATPLDRWKISCSVDKGAITKKRGIYTFKTSNNRCPGGTFNQRAEINSEKVPPTTRGAYLFKTTVAMMSRSNEQFDIFQIHDGRDGCAPPLKVQVGPNGTIRLQSAVKLGPGENCKPEDRTTGRSDIKLGRNGTQQDLRVLIQFDGKGGFSTHVWLDDRLAVKGNYTPSTIPTAFRSKHFYFKHGVYSKNMFEYQMTSSDMNVRKVKISE